MDSMVPKSEENADSFHKLNHPCWLHLPANVFRVRQGPDYQSNAQKQESDSALLEHIQSNLSRTNTKTDHIAEVMQLPSDLNKKTYDLLIVNFQIPSYPPSNPVWGEDISDGPGYSLVLLFRIPPEIRNQLNEETPSTPALQLLKEFLTGEDSMKERFKLIPRLVNHQHSSLSCAEQKIINAYDSKPILSRPQHRFYSGEGYFEVDIDIHEFCYLARRALFSLLDRVNHFVFDLACVIEGRKDCELPEQILGCVRFCKLDWESALELVDPR